MIGLIIYIMIGLSAILFSLSIAFYYCRIIKLSRTFGVLSTISANIAICIMLCYLYSLGVPSVFLGVFYALELYSVYADRIKAFLNSRSCKEFEMMSGQPSTVSVTYTINTMVSSGDGTEINYTLTNSTTGYTEIHNDSFDTMALDQGVLSTMSSGDQQSQMRNNFLALSRTTFESFSAAVRVLIANNDLSNLTGGVVTLSESIPILCGVIDIE